MKIVIRPQRADRKRQNLHRQQDSNEMTTTSILDEGAISSFAVLARWFRRHSLSLAEALTLCISIVFSTQIHSIVCMTSNHHQVAFFRCIRCCKQGLLAHYCILARIAACTAKKRVLFGPRDVDCDSAHAATTLSLPVVAFEMLGSM